MDVVRIHLALSHAPIFWTALGILILIFGMLRKNETAIRIALASFVLSGLVAVVVYLSGKGAEEVVEHISGVSERYIDKHEDLATGTLISTVALGILSTAVLILRRLSSIILGFMLAFSSLDLLLLVNTGNYGGKIRHVELISSPSFQEYEYEDEED